MAQVFTGRDGRLLINDSIQLKVTNWTLTGALEVLETTTLGEYQRSYVPGVQEFTGSATLLYYVEDGRNDAATALKNILKTSGVQSTDTVKIQLRLLEGARHRNCTMNAYITSVTYGASVGEISSAQISFVATGALLGVSL